MSENTGKMMVSSVLHSGTQDDGSEIGDGSLSRHTE